MLSDTELAAITERGGHWRGVRRSVVALAADAVQAANPKTVEGQHCLARKEYGRWTVIFGALNGEKNKFVIQYEAQPGSRPKEFTVTKDLPAKEDQGFYLFAARALDLALADFGRASRPYNAAILPSAQDQQAGAPAPLYVYLYPAQTRVGVFPLGGDVRYLVSADGLKILAKRQMHKTVIENTPAKGKKVVSGFHNHVLSDEPEDSDVLHVLQQDPPIPEMIATQHFLFEISEDGSIRIRKQKKITHYQSIPGKIACGVVDFTRGGSPRDWRALRSSASSEAGLGSWCDLLDVARHGCDRIQLRSQIR